MQSSSLYPALTKTRENPLYDDRIVQVCNGIVEKIGGEVRDIIIQTEDLDCFHDGARLRPDTLAEYYTIDEDLIEPKPSVIGIVDDVLTTGSHFKAAQSVLQAVWPEAKIVGLFLARVYREPEIPLVIEDEDD
jgi:hypothetical protein